MGKNKKLINRRSKEKVVPRKKISSLDYFEHPKFIIGYFILLFIILIILYKPIVFEGLEPNGGDYVSNIGITKQIKTWQEKISHLPLWNPYMFAGMPTYQHFGPQIWSVDTVLNKLDYIIDWRIWYLLAGALGLFLLLRFFQLPSIVSLISASAFILMPHFQALIIVGHFSKFRALMWIPYVLLTFLYLIKERSLLSGLLFCLALSIQFRTQHYQIIFYNFLLVLCMGIPPIYRLMKDKKWIDIWKLTIYSVLAILFALIIFSQSFFSIKEYTPYSTRGGYAISLNEPTETQQDKKGVGFDYATMWSYSLSEFWNLIVPMFHGGTSNEIYSGNAFPNLKNRQLPTYWGSMPFTQSYEYLGILIVFFALIGIVLQWKRWEVKSITFLTLFSLLMSLGKNLPFLYKPFFFYFPYFDKFRAPVMILTLVMFNSAILAAFGISAIIKEELRSKKILQRLYIISGIFIGLLIIPLLFGSSFSLTHLGEERQYAPEAINMLKTIRLEMLKESALTSLIFLLVGVGCILIVKKEWLKVDFVAIILLVAVNIDFLLLDSHYLKDKFIDPKVIEEQQYRPNQIDMQIKQDQSLYRVFPFGQLYSDVHWVYHHQSIGGYSPAKLQVIQEIADNCLYSATDTEVPINWNILKILNVKYIIINQQLNSSKLKFLTKQEETNMQLLLYEETLPRAYFVEKYTVISDGVKRLSMLNNPRFDPIRTAILEKTPGDIILTPDSSHVEIIKYEPEEIVLDVYTDQPALLVLSEIYYPAGWQAVLDETKELEIFKTNHLVRSMAIPKGKHSLKLHFRPESYYAGIKLSLAGVLITHLLTLFLIYRKFGYSMLSKRREKAGHKM